MPFGPMAACVDSSMALGVPGSLGVTIADHSVWVHLWGVQRATGGGMAGQCLGWVVRGSGPGHAGVMLPRPKVSTGPSASLGPQRDSGCEEASPPNNPGKTSSRTPTLQR